MAYRKPEFDKPFDFVPFTEKTDKRSRPGHDSFRLQELLAGELDYELVVEAPLHISSGNYALTEELGLPAKQIVRDLYKISVDGTRLPAVPGSTLKGASRAVAEAVTNSCVGVTRVSGRDLPSGVDRRGCRAPSLCPACGVYGAMSRLGRVSFSDAVFVIGQGDAMIAIMPALYQPRPRQGNAYRDRARRYKGRKFYYHGRYARQKEGHYVEVLKPKSRLRGQVAFTGLAPAELGLVFFSLGLDGSFQLAIGGGKPVAMGRVRIEPVEMRLRRTASFTEYETGDAILSDDMLAEAVSGYIRAAERELVQEVQQTELRRILDPANRRPAPTGVY